MIAVLGGTGDFGQGLAARLRRAGEDVVLGSRTPRDEFVANSEACARAEVVFCSVPPAGVAETAAQLAPPLVAGPQELEEMVGTVRQVLDEAWERITRTRARTAAS